MSEVYIGHIEDIIPPSDIRSKTKIEYEYTVIISGSYGSKIPLFNVRRVDEFGAGDDYNDVTLMIGQRALVVCPKGELYHAYIIGAMRSSQIKTGETHHWTRRFNQVEETIFQNGTWQVKSDDSPFMKMTRSSIQLDVDGANNIIIDKEAKTITINADQYVVNVSGSATINTGSDCTINCKSTATINGTSKVNINSKEVSITASADVKIKAKKAEIDAQQVTIAGQEGQVITTATQPACYVTGIPFIGSTKVKAGS